MTQEEVWTALKDSILEVLPEYMLHDIRPEASLRDFGANSIDRAEIIMLALSRLKLKIPLVEFAPAKNNHDLMTIFLAHARYETVT